MTWKINGVIVSETSKVNSNLVWGTGKKMNGVQLNVCYEYELSNNNPPFPPSPPIQFSYDDCNGDPQTADIMAGGPPTTVCAIVDSVNVPGGGSSNKGSRC